jgi:dipeptidyl aminopeptidase/acylaminoacyl peptidase
MMNDALRNAGKQVQYLRIDGDDHSLVEDASRRQVLTALGAFLKTHIGQ